MLISGREARARLEAAGFSSRHARVALDCGLAGIPRRTKAAHLYDRQSVRDLANRPSIDWRTVFETCPEGIFVARRALDVTRSHAELVEQASNGWDGLDPWVRVAMSFQIEKLGGLPFVATVAGVVVLGADIVGGRPRCGLRLAEPGEWFERLRGARLSTGPGRPWVLHLA
jgi:hypothetical protein